MSELIQKHDNRATIRWKLLTGASALALAAYVTSADAAGAEDAGRPTIWIELGGQMEMMQSLSAPFTPPFMQFSPTPDPYKLDSPISAQKAPRYALGLDGKITFQPEDSDWIFSAGIRYGRSHGKKHVHHQTAIPTRTITPCISFYGYLYCHTSVVKFPTNKLADTKTIQREQHAVLDFAAGKDVGLGLLGRHGNSAVNVGVRFAQFSTNMKVDAYLRPAIGSVYAVPTFDKYPQPTFHEYTMHARAARSFRGVGPSLSWIGSAVIAGNAQAGELLLDWDVNGAVLFGKQRAKTDHETRATQAVNHGSHWYTIYPTHPHHSTRSRNVTVPNIGGSVGVSVKYSNFKMSIGYRYDTFLKAMDTGIDARKTSNLTFNGPYASISIGLGN